MRTDVFDEAEKDRPAVIDDDPTTSNGIEAPAGGDDRARLKARAKEIIDSLDELSSEAVFAAFEELDALPPDIVRPLLLARTGPALNPELLDDATRRAHGFPEPRLVLRRTSVTRDADVLDLGPGAEEQLRVAGRSWDGRDLAAEERLDGELEDSFAGTVEHHVFADAADPAAPPLFDVLPYATDAGAVFRAGTSELVGAIAYGHVEMKDRRVRAAIQDVLARPPAEGVEAEEAAPRPAPTKKSTATKKASLTSANKRATGEPKKTGAKKSATKKPAAKKSAAKKPAAKKSTAKRKTVPKDGTSPRS